jgi:hypothetical protein
MTNKGQGFTATAERRLEKRGSRALTKSHRPRAQTQIHVFYESEQ